MKTSAGILLYRLAPPLVPETSGQLSLQHLLQAASPSLQFLLVHPGGPFWAKKDAHAWSIPKGGSMHAAPATGTVYTEENETLEETARREFHEETGMCYDGPLTPLPAVRTSHKIIYAFLGSGDFDPAFLRSNLFEMEWPPKSGRMHTFPEVDKAAWFDPETAKLKINKGQVSIIEAAVAHLADITRNGQ